MIFVATISDKRMLRSKNRLIHRSARKKNSANFACSEFSQRIAMNLNRVARWTHEGIHTLGYQDVIDESHCQAGSPAKGSGEANISAIRCTRLFGEH